MPRFGWRWLLGLSSIPCFAALLLYSFVVESPRYLYMKGRISDTHNVLKNMASVNQTKLPPGLLVPEHTTHQNLASLGRVKLLSNGIKEEPGFFKAGFSSVLMLFSSGLVKTTLLLWVVYFGNAFSYYGIILLTSELVSEESKCGMTSHTLHSSSPNLYRDVLITSFSELPGLALSAIIVDYMGRKKSMALMYGLGFIFLIPLVGQQHEILTTILLFGARMCMIGTFTVAGIYCPEVYPTAIRSTGYGVASAVGRIGGMICPLVAIQMVTDCHQVYAIVLFEVVITLAGISVMLFPFETRGRKLTDTVELCSSC